jgi:hypothetical protein
LTNAHELEDRVAVAKRGEKKGGKAFVDKVLRVQKAGARALHDACAHESMDVCRGFARAACLAMLGLDDKHPPCRNHPPPVHGAHQ